MRHVLLAAAIIGLLCLSYGVAVLGEPQSAWFWRMLGVLD
jgi:hypothetical protein